MALYAIGDLHLSLSADKPMDVFGKNWENYVQRIQDGFSELGEDDTCVICGDISWAMNMEDASEDFIFISKLPGKKIILKGNHDYWWTTATKAKKHMDKLEIKGIDFLHNNCYFYNDIAICGTRGWFFEEERHGDGDKKIMQREIGRLQRSLECAGERCKYVFLHYPPIYKDYVCDEILELFSSFDVKICASGHIHSHGLKHIFQGFSGKTEHFNVSADYLGFKPKKILD